MLSSLQIRYHENGPTIAGYEEKSNELCDEETAPGEKYPVDFRDTDNAW